MKLVNMRGGIVGLVTSFSLIVAACGSDESPSGAAGGGAAGQQSDGGAGSGGTAGTGGSAGSGGSTGGSAGAAGSAGQGGTAGEAGSAGDGGSGGQVSWIEPGDPGPHDVALNIDSGSSVRPISNYIYGVNSPDWNGGAKHLGLGRVGGNRWSAYNWENNASNAGTDWQNQSDGYLGGGDTPGEAVRPRVQDAHDAGASMLVTIPILGYVAADKSPSGDVNQTPNYLQVRFHETVARKGAAFEYPPNVSDDKVYQDEFVAWLEAEFPGARTDPQRTIFYSLDNEPDLWADTHVRIHSAKATYAELVAKAIDFASAIKDAAPGAQVFGPVNYGWQGFVNLQDAPDAAGRDFLEYYLEEMSKAETAQGKRLLDVLDVHWYPEAQGGNVRITGDSTDPAVVQARVQAPRSLWDSDYTEQSWITQWSTMGPIQLLPRLGDKIQSRYPGTKLAITEYYYGAGGHISGGIAQADVLGIYGRDGLFAACMWPLGSDQSFVYGAFSMFRNYDGNGAAFGDTSVEASTSDTAATSVYASMDGNAPERLIVVAINKTDQPQVAGITLRHTSALTQANVYQLTAAGSAPSSSSALQSVDTNAFSYAMPSMSVSTLVFTP